MPSQNDQWFNSAVDWWLRLILVSLPVISVGSLVLSVIEGEGIGAALIGVLIVGGIFVGLLMPVKYGLEAEHLVVRFGFARKRIAYREIRAVRPTRNPLSSPALSLDRLRIEVGKGFMTAVMISPTPRDEFLTALARRTGLKHEGDSLVSVDRTGDPS